MTSHFNSPPGKLRIALGEYDLGWEAPVTSISRVREIAKACAGAGADLVALPEMSTTGFSMDPARVAEPIGGRSVTELAEIARALGIHLLAGVATSVESNGKTEYFNSALLFDSRGEIVTEYRKQKLFAYGGEAAAYSPGDAPVVMNVNGVYISPFICFDLRFPELFRAVASRVDAMMLIANWPAARRGHWDALTRARAIENQCYFIGVNRTGSGGGLDYDGGSVAYGPWGEPLRSDVIPGSPVRMVEIDSAEVTRVRTQYPFNEDHRIE